MKDTNDKSESLDIARRVMRSEAEAITVAAGSLDDTFDKIVRKIMSCTSKIVVIGMGKSGHIARKAAATFSSLGSSAVFLHPSECAHGDLGAIRPEDVVIIISRSGESDEIKNLLTGIHRIGAYMIGITSNADSTLARSCALLQILPYIDEACHLRLAPTVSTTMTLAYCDALAIAAAELRNFSKNDFGNVHPAGSLGKSIMTRVSDLMVTIGTRDVATENSTLLDVLDICLRTGLSVIIVTDGRFGLQGIITADDLMNAVKSADSYDTDVTQIIRRRPMYVNAETLAVEALRVFADNTLDVMPVLSDGRIAGVISQKSILSAGIYI